jgi:hypothetical protein
MRLIIKIRKIWWLGSDISAREQQIIIKKCWERLILWQGFPRGPSLAPSLLDFY